jgi:hypothetical protein
MQNAIELYSKLNDPLTAIDKIGTFFAKSGMFGCDKEEQGKVLAMVCLAENKSPVVITRTYHIMDGKLSKKALAALAEFRSRGGKHKWIKTGDEPGTGDERCAIGEFAWEGEKMTVSYSLGNARTQGLIKDRSNWVKTPGNMLRARVITNALGMLAPEIFAGDGDGEEIAATPEAAPLNLCAQPATATVQPKPETKVTTIDVQAEKVVPAPEPAPQPATTAPAPVAEDDIMTLCTKVEEIIGENVTAAQVWFTKNNYLKEGQTLAQIDPIKLKKIIAQPAAFVRAIKVS